MMSSDINTTLPSKGTILVVDDAMDMRVFMSALFKTSGYTVETCREGSAGLAKAKQMLPDLIILDVMMPGTGGAMMYKSLKTNRKLSHIPVIIMSAVGERSFQHYLKMLNLNLMKPLPGPDCYLDKPPNAQQLLDAVNRLLA